MKRKNGFTKKEKEIVLDKIRMYPDNLQHAFLEASKMISRSQASISRKYYSFWRNDEDFKAVTVGSNKGFTQNIKNTVKKEGIFPEERKLNKPLWLIQIFLELDKEQQNLIKKLIA